MNKITDILPQKNKTELVDVYVNNEYLFSCHIEIVKKTNLKSGMIIDKEDIFRIIDEENIRSGFLKALNYLSYAPRTQKEIAAYLKAKDYNDHIVTQIIDKLKYYGYINDRQFASDFIKYRSENQSKGKRWIMQQLLDKGISKETIDSLLKEYPEEVERSIAKKLSEKFFLQKKNLPFKQILHKLSNKLYANGFSWEIINECIYYLENSKEVQSILLQQEDHYYNEALKIAHRYYNKYVKKEKNQYNIKNKIYFMLIQKGFNRKIAEKAIDEIFPNPLL